MRWRWLSALVVVLAGGCVGTSDDGGHRDESGPPAPPASVTSPSPVAPAGLADVAAFEAAGIQATRVAPDLVPDQPLDVRGGYLDVVAAGNALVSFTYGDRDGLSRLVRSRDLGRSWEQVEPPGAVVDGDFGSVSDAGELAVVTDDHDGTAYAWASSDGTIWNGGPVRLEREAFLLASPYQLPDGRLVVGNQPTPDGDGLIVSADGGDSWRNIDCPRTSRLVVPPQRRCEPVVAAGRGLWLRTFQTSLDDGRTWHDVSVVPDPDSVIRPRMDSAVPLPERGWLGSVSTQHDAEDRLVAYLVRSTDGVRWERVIPDPCTRPGHSGSRVSAPVPLGDRWLVAYTCRDDYDTPLLSQLFLIDGDGTLAQPLATVERPYVSFGQPLAAGDTVVVPEIEGEESLGGTVTFLQLRS